MKKRLIRLIATVCMVSILSTNLQIVTQAQMTTPAVPSDPAISSAIVGAGQPETATILQEDVSLREENVKYFICDDRTTVATIYNHPVHYRDGEEWKDIDNSLVAETDEKERTYYKNKANTFQVQIPSQMGNSTPVVITNGKYRLQWIMPDTTPAVANILPGESADSVKVTANKRNISTTEESSFINQEKMQLSKQQGSVMYRGVTPSADVRYDVIGNKIKESIILKKYIPSAFFAFDIQADGMTAVLQKDQSVHFYAEGEEQPVFVIDSPYMIDGDGAYSDDVRVSLQMVNGYYRYTLTPSDEWLSASERQYPVVIDPTVTTELSRDQIESSRVYSRYPTKNYGDADVLSAGTTQVNGTIYQYQSLIKLPMPTILEGSNYKVVSASLVLHGHPDNDTEAKNSPIYLHKITSAWDENTVTWNTKPTYETNKIISYDINFNGEGINNFDITTLVDGWMKDSASNHGVLLRGSVTTEADMSQWYNDYLHDDYATARPYAVIVYRECAGLEDYWTYTSMSVGRGATAAVNTATGMLTCVVPGSGIGGNVMPVSISLVYNAGNVKQATYGGKWRVNYQMSVESTGISSAPYRFIDGDGTPHYFIKSGTEWKDEDGLGLTLTVNESSTTARYTITDQSKNKMIFSTGIYTGTRANEGVLTIIQDTHNNNIKIQYQSQRINTITDGSGRVYQFAYDSSNRLYTITDPAGNVTKYAYNDWSELRNIYYKGEWLYQILYTNAKVRVINCYPENGERLLMLYENTTSTARATQMLRSAMSKAETDAVESYAFSYLVNATDITDHVGNKFTYQYNNFFQTVCVVSHEDGRAQSYKHGKPGNINGTENKLLSASDTQKSVINHAVNGTLDDNYTTNSTFTAIGSGVSYDSTVGHTAKGSIKVTGTSAYAQTPVSYARQIYTIPVYSNYILSAYVKTDGIADDFEAVISMQYKTTAGNVSTPYWVVQEDTGTDGWTRITTQLTGPVNGQFYLNFGVRSTGTAWFDDIQLEPISWTANTFNLLENTDFRTNMRYWGMGAGNWSRVSNTNGAPGETDYMIKVSGVPTQHQRFYQAVRVTNGKKGDVFSMGAWGKADSCDIVADSSSSADKAFGIRLEFYKNNNCIDAQRINFNPHYTGWQFVSGEAIAKADYDMVALNFEYSYNVNTAYFALPYLYKDHYGQSYTYDNDGNVVTSADRTAAQTSYAYNDDNLSKLATPTGSEQLMSYADNGDLTLAQTTDGQLYQYTYDADGNPLSAKVNGSKYATTLSPNTAYIIQNAYSGNVFTVPLLAHDQVFTNQRRVQGQATQSYMLVSAGETGVYTIRPTDSVGASIRVDVEGGTDTNGLRLQLYNNNDHATQRFKFQQNDNGSFTILTKVSNYTKCIDGQPGDATDTDNGTPIQQRTVVAGDAGQQWYFFPVNTAMNAPSYYYTTATYTADGNYMASSTDSLGKTTTYTTDSEGRTTSITTPDNTTTSYTYEYESCAESTYHKIHKVTTKVSRAGTTLQSSVVSRYDQDRITSITNALGMKYSFVYDDYGRSSGVYVGEAVDGNDTVGINLAKYTYNTAGLLNKLTYGNGVYANYSYDPLGRLTQMWYYEEKLDSGFRKEYNARGQLGVFQDNAARLNTWYDYDLSGRLTNVRKVKTDNELFGSIGYIYEDGTNRLTNILTKTPFHSLNTGFVYGNAKNGQMPDVVYGVKRDNTTELTYTYDYLGRLAIRNLSAIGKQTTYVYESSSSGGYQTSDRVSMVIGPDGNTWQHTYDSSGLLSGIKNNDTMVESYLYDSLGQLTTANVDGRNYSYSSDRNGNWLSANKNGETSTYTYGNPLWKDQLTAYNGQTITYDEIGNPLTYRDGITFIWKNGRQLATHTKDNITIHYQYNADGGRRKKYAVDSTTHEGVWTDYYYVDGVLLAEEVSDSHILVYLYDENGAPYGLQYKGVTDTAFSTYYYQYNTKSDIIGLYDSTGALVVTYTYDPWGKVLSVTDSTTIGIGNLNPLRFKGYYYDTETGLYLTGTRYYDPEIGRFINADGYVSTGQGILGTNMFAYCGNNPIIRADPSGQFWEIVIGVTLVVGLVASLSGCSAKPKPEPYKSADDAAKAFSEQVYSSSSYIRHEYSTEIYSRTINGETTYNYNPPRAGNPHSASVGNSTPKGTKTVAYAHTHPNSNVFSGADIRAAENLKIDAYVVGPNLELQRYSLSSASTTNLGVISPIALTDAQRSSLVTEFQVSWDAHIADGCDFNCGSMVWPTP